MDWLAKGLALGPYSADNICKICMDLFAPHLKEDEVNGHRESAISIIAGSDKDRFKSDRVSTVNVL